MLRALHRLRKGTRAAVAPTVALSLFALIGMGGVAFDYAHLVTLDTELQQAADNAALAAATQLDRSDAAQARAAAAIQNPGSNRLAANITRFANDGSASGEVVEVADITFCSEFDDAIADTTAAWRGCDPVGGPIPEPGSLILVGSALMLGASRLRRRRTHVTR